MKSDCSDDITAFMKELTMNTRIKSTAIAFAVAGLFAVQPAAADTLTWGGFTNGYARVDFSRVTPAGTLNNIAAGQFLMTNVNTSTTFKAWCADAFPDLAASQGYTLQSASAFYTSLGDAGKATALSYLASNSLASVTDADHSAAFALAVWEIVNEISGSGYSLTGGNFTATSANSNVLTYASSMLGNLSGTITMTANIWAQDNPGTTQDLVVFAPVPEPETYAMMLAGLGMMGFVVRRRKRNEAA